MTAEGYGTATDTFRTVGESIEMEENSKQSISNVQDFGFEQKNYAKTISVFGLDKIPSNSTSFFTYQLTMIEDDEDDDGIRPDGTEIEINPNCAEQSSDEILLEDPESAEITHNTELDAEKMILYSIDCLEEDDVLITPDEVRTSSDGSAIVSLTAFEGPSISFDIIATAEGYAEGKDTFTVNVDAPERTFDAIDLELPEWIIYIVIGGILMVGVVVVMFLRKSKADLEEECEEEDI